MERSAQLESYPGADLLDFVTRRMRLASYYQPLVIRSLILAPGHRLPARELARHLLLEDRFAVEKALKTLKRWPKTTLHGHGIAYYNRQQREFILPVIFDSTEQRDQILMVCGEAISTWHQKEMPKVASRFYRLIEAAGGRCQACGVLARSRPLDIDHIVPREKARAGFVTLPGGAVVPVDDEDNLQVLCSRCNRGKRDASTYDFRPSEQRLAETVRLTLELAKEAGYRPGSVLASALDACGLDLGKGA